MANLIEIIFQTEIIPNIPKIATNNPTNPNNPKYSSSFLRNLK